MGPQLGHLTHERKCDPPLRNYKVIETESVAKVNRRVKLVRVGLLLCPLNWCIGLSQWRILARSGGTNEGLLSRRG